MKTCILGEINTAGMIILHDDFKTKSQTDVEM